MAVSKTQNERPAIVALIDAVNMTEPIVAQNVQDIATLNEGLGAEISNRESADTRLDEAIRDEAETRAQSVQGVTDSLAATNSTVESIDNTIGDGIFSPNFTITQGFRQAGAQLLGMSGAIDNINNWQDRFRLGITQQFTVAPNDSHTGAVTFDSPFNNDAQVLVLPNCLGQGASFGTLECRLISSSYDGFSFEVSNSDSDNSYTISIGFIAVQVN